MAAGDVAVLIASIACVASVVGLFVSIAVLGRQTRRLAKLTDELRVQTVPLVAEAQRLVGHAAAEMERVGSVLESTESVHAAVDSASQLAYRAFANPIVKVLALRAGAAGSMRWLRVRPVSARERESSGRSGARSPIASQRLSERRSRTHA